MNPLVAKLDTLFSLPNEDKEALERALSKSIRHVAAHKDIIREGDAPAFIHVVLSGWACRYKELKAGRRQIIALFLPGDICDHSTIFARGEVDHSVSAITSTMLAQSPRECIQAILAERPRIAQALWRETLYSMATQDERIANLGLRAYERIAHFFCEIFVRQRLVGLTCNNTCQMPLTQAELGEAMGLSVVHVNRVLRDLRAAHLVELNGKSLTIPDFQALASECSFGSDYLRHGPNGLDRDPTAG